MQDFKYFTYGYSPDLRNPMYGLYQPVLNCFLIVFPDYDIVGPQLASILSSRYLLQPIRIDSADNYAHNVIDNEVCENWTISNRNEILPNDIMIGVKVLLANQLMPFTRPVTELIQIAKEKQWAQFCLFWLRFIKLECQTGASGLWIDSQIGSLDIFNMFEPVLAPQYTKVIANIMSLLYQGRDLDTTEQAIIDLVNNTGGGLKDRLTVFLEGYNESTKNITNKFK
jgi:hypothetical protein